MRTIEDWAGKVTEILAWIVRRKVPFAEITLTVKGGKVTFVDYRGPLREARKMTVVQKKVRNEQNH